MSLCIRVRNILCGILFSVIFPWYWYCIFIDIIALRLTYDHLQVLSISEENKADTCKRT